MKGRSPAADAIIAEIIHFRTNYNYPMSRLAPLLGMSRSALERTFYRARMRGEIPSDWTPSGGPRDVFGHRK